MENIKTFLVAFVVFLGIDMLWLTVIAQKFYKSQIGHLMADKARLLPAAIFYLLFIAALAYFVIVPALEHQNLTKLIVSAAIFGLVTYATYDLTNMATLKDWPLLVTVVDLAWGTFISLAVSLITYLLLFVSGIPIQEKGKDQNPAWREYATKTPRFVPFIGSKKC
jgi:Predicted membrane protein